MENVLWRAATAQDLPALSALEAACWPVDGPVLIPPPAYGDLLAEAAVSLICAVDLPRGLLVAAGWTRRTGTAAELGGQVHPAYRRQGLGTHLLRWTEQAACAGEPPPSRLVIYNEHLNAGSIALYAQEGYSQEFAINWMQRDLGEPVPADRAGLSYASWTAATVPEFYRVYSEAWRTRPRFPPSPSAEWIAEYVDDPDFWPDLSLLALIAGAPVGFITSGLLRVHPLDQKVGWISQVGVLPAWQGRGIAAALVTAVLAGFARADQAAVALHVNLDNPRAVRVYERLGFQAVGQRAKYTKPAGPDPGIGFAPGSPVSADGAT